jgi:hypothetical protein
MQATKHRERRTPLLGGVAARASGTQASGLVNEP